jgi:hypothetical protein
MFMAAKYHGQSIGFDRASTYHGIALRWLRLSLVFSRVRDGSRFANRWVGDHLDTPVRPLSLSDRIVPL